MRALPPAREPAYGQILHLAWPIILANVASPLLGLVDTAVIGHTRSASGLGAIAVGSLVLNFIYWAFGFLRMSTTGFVAQAVGADDSAAARAASLRALGTGLVFGLLITALQVPLAAISFSLMSAPGEVEQLGRSYFALRIWAAPATLATYALSGVLIGFGRMRQLLALQVLLNGINIALDLLFAGVLDWGVRGIAIGTLVAEWTAALFGLWLVIGTLREQHRDQAPFVAWSELRHGGALRHTLHTQGNIMVRTLAMLVGFAWFTRLGAQLGEVTLAANHVLLGLISFCAFFLDGFALPAETLVGTAQGRGDRRFFDRAVHRTSVLAIATAVVLAIILMIFGRFIVGGMTDLAAVRTMALHFLPYAAVYVAVSVFAFQLDGVFVGTTHAAEMRNASLVAAAIFLVTSGLFTSAHGNQALWLAFIAYVVMRALTLAVYYPRVRRGMDRGRR